ncbi:MAG: hypothetical protein AB7F61_18755, partial [Desulfobulbus sp.]
GKSSLRPLMAGSSPSLPDGSNPSAAIVQSASDVQCSRLLKTTHPAEVEDPDLVSKLLRIRSAYKTPLKFTLIFYRVSLRKSMAKSPSIEFLGRRKDNGRLYPVCFLIFHLFQISFLATKKYQKPKSNRKTDVQGERKVGIWVRKHT